MSRSLMRVKGFFVDLQQRQRKGFASFKKGFFSSGDVFLCLDGR